MIIFKFIICTVLLLVPISGLLIAIGLFVEGMRCIKKESDDDGDDHLRIIITYRPDDFKSDSENRPILENLTKKDTAKPSRSFRDAVL